MQERNLCSQGITPSKIKKSETIQYRKSRIWEMKEDKYAKASPKSGLCDMTCEIFGKYFTQIYKALYGDTMLVSLLRGTNIAAKNQRNICL